MVELDPALFAGVDGDRDNFDLGDFGGQGDDTGVVFDLHSPGEHEGTPLVAHDLETILSVSQILDGINASLNEHQEALQGAYAQMGDELGVKRAEVFATQQLSALHTALLDLRSFVHKLIQAAQGSPQDLRPGSAMESLAHFQCEAMKMSIFLGNNGASIHQEVFNLPERLLRAAHETAQLLSAERDNNIVINARQEFIFFLRNTFQQLSKVALAIAEEPRMTGEKAISINRQCGIFAMAIIDILGASQLRGHVNFIPEAHVVNLRVAAENLLPETRPCLEMATILGKIEAVQRAIQVAVF